MRHQSVNDLQGIIMILLKVIIFLFGSGPVLSHKPQFKGSKPITGLQPVVVTASPQQLNALGSYGLAAKDLWNIDNPNSWEPKVVKVEITHELIKEVSPKFVTSPKLESGGWVPMNPSWKTNENDLKPLYPGAKGLYQWNSNSKHETWKHNVYAPHVQKPNEDKYVAPQVLQQKVPHIYSPNTYSQKNPYIYSPNAYSQKNPHIYSPNAYSQKNPHIYSPNDYSQKNPHIYSPNSYSQNSLYTSSPNVHSQNIRWSEPDPYVHGNDKDVYQEVVIHHDVHNDVVLHNDHQDVHHFDDHHDDSHHYDDHHDNYHHFDDYNHYDEVDHDDFHNDYHYNAHHHHHKDRGYKFNYGVASSHTGDVKTHQEKKNGDHVEGKYTVKEADGSTREVHYKAGKHTGFNAVVKNRGKLSSSYPIHSHHKGWKGHNRIYGKAYSHQHVSKGSYPLRHAFRVKHVYKS